MRIVLLTLVLLLPGQVLAVNPDTMLDEYFEILLTRNFDNIGTLMDPGQMQELKALLDGVMKTELKGGNFGMQVRIFGKKVTLSEIEKTQPDFYLRKLAGSIRDAANVSHFYVTDRTILGRIDETPELVHYVVRLHLQQDEKTASDIYVYTLVKYGDDWKLKFPPTIRQMVGMIEAAAAAQRETTSTP